MAEGNITGPEGILMLMIAVPLDLAGIILLVLSFFGIGIPLSFLLDILGMAIIGGWLLIRTGSVKTTKGVQDIAKKAAKRFGFTFLAELVPFLGDVYPGWTILVWKELKG